MMHEYHVEQQLGSYLVADEFGHAAHRADGSMLQFADYGRAARCAASLNGQDA